MSKERVSEKAGEARDERGADVKEAREMTALLIS